jgi:hypothetical protein
MISIGNWSIRLIPENRRINKFHNYKEWFFIYYKGGLCGTLHLCDFDNKWFVHILHDNLRKKFYKDNAKYYTKNIVKTRQGGYALKKERYVLADELVRLYYLDTETKNMENDFYCRIKIGELFDKIYKNKVSKKQILLDLKKEYQNINNYINDRQIKSSIVKIFQVQDLILNLHNKSCKKRKSGSFWDLCNL